MPDTKVWSLDWLDNSNLSLKLRTIADWAISCKALKMPGRIANPLLKSADCKSALADANFYIHLKEQG